MNTYTPPTKEELISNAISRASQLNPDFNSIDITRLEKAAAEHVETERDWVDGICFDLTYND